LVWRLDKYCEEDTEDSDAIAHKAPVVVARGRKSHAAIEMWGQIEQTLGKDGRETFFRSSDRLV